MTAPEEILAELRQRIAAAAEDGQDWQARAETAEGTLARVRTVLLEGGQDAATARRRALAISGEQADGPLPPPGARS